MNKPIVTLSLALLLSMVNINASAEHAARHAASLVASPPVNADITGTAINTTTNEIAYFETFVNDPSGDSARVKYWTATGELISTKEVDFSRTPTAPNLVQTDMRFNERLAVERVNDVLRVSYDKSDEAGRVREVRFDDNLVVDAGFHHFVLDNWETLRNNGGETLRFEFLQLKRARTVGLEVRHLPCDTDASELQTCFELRVANPILRLFLDPIMLTYSEDRRLVRYTGIAQLTDENGDALVVDLRYEYR